MRIDDFWNIIARTTGPRVYEEQEELIVAELSKLSREELIQFDAILNQLFFNAYRWDLWAVAYMQLGGCSDDAFMDYRYWLVFQGKQMYEKGISDPDSMADFLAEWGDEAGIEGYGYLPAQIYRRKFGDEMPASGLRHSKGDPKGEAWEEDDLEKRFPRVAKIFQGNWL